MSTTIGPSPAISHAFDREAEGYAATWDASPIVQIWRGRILAAVLTRVPSGGRIVDLGCGTGTDAVALRACGYAVRGVDASPGMVREARARGVDAEVGSWAEAARLGGGHDAALSDFGVLNCAPDLGGPAAALAALVAPGGWAFLVWMSPRCPRETLARLARGQRPRRGRPTAQVAGVSVPLRWWTVAEVTAALHPAFTVEHVEAIGLLDTAPDLGGRPGRLTRWEPALAALPGLRTLGDHTLLVARRAA